MARPVIALLTDFGSRDHYVGAMKGVMLGICPDATLVDVTHGITPHAVVEGALELASSYRYFPAGTVFVVVVDPGVGSNRKGLAVEAGDYRFVAPDNGVLTAVLRETPPKKVVEVTDRRYIRPTVSRTFEGRDRFAPAAAWIAKGIQLSALGRPVSDYHLLDLPIPSATDAGIEGVVVRVDRFGNLVSNIDRRTFDRLAEGGKVHLQVGTAPVQRLVATYADIAPDEVCALFGSTDCLEIALREASAAQRLGLGRGASVRVARLEA